MDIVVFFAEILEIDIARKRPSRGETVRSVSLIQSPTLMTTGARNFLARGTCALHRPRPEETAAEEEGERSVTRNVPPPKSRNLSEDSEGGAALNGITLP